MDEHAYTYSYVHISTHGKNIFRRKLTIHMDTHNNLIILAILDKWTKM